MTADLTEQATSRTYGGHPIRHRDKSGLIHSCQGSEVHPGIMLIWTDCERDVPASKGYISIPTDEVTCPKCLAAQAKRREQIG